jgi:hypothetical protein
MKKPWLVWAGMAFILGFTFNLHAQSTAPDSIVQLAAQVQGLNPVSLGDLPDDGTFWWVTTNGVTAPMPCPPFDPSLPVYQIADGEYLVDDTDGNVAMDGQSSVSDAVESLSNAVVELINQVQTPPSQPMTGSRMAGGMMAMDDDEGGDFTPDSSLDTNSLYLQIMDATNGQADLILNNATDEVYEVMSKTDLSVTNWTIETEVWPTNSTAMPFSISEQDRTNLFIWAMDWTGVTENGNTTPDWWFWKYFGTTDLSDTNLDGMGSTLLFDYTYGRDPNVIQFYLEFTNTFLNTSPACGTVTVFAGMPSYEAVLINDTNTADAVWEPYSSNVVVSLNSGNGTYNVMFGLKGLPADAQQTWQFAQLTLYSVPLNLTITSPTNSTVCQPLIQLQGYAGESLDSVTFDVSNAAGIFTNQTGYVTSQFYDTNLLEFTTNDFQCYVVLTNGINAITLQATDMASNTVTTNFNITFDPTTDTNPPSFALVWPQNNTTIGGSNFTVQAQVSDPTAVVVATINGNSTQGIVEQSGTVWVKNLPLNSGTNMVTLTATNIAGVGSTTNFDVVQSPVSLTVDPISSDQQNQASVTVTGTVGNPGDVVSVNGVQATVNDDGTWEADGVPVNAVGTASVDAEVTDSGSNSVASQVSYQAQPASVVLMSYLNTAQFHGYTYIGSGWFAGDSEYGFNNDSWNWSYSTGGSDNYMGYSSADAEEFGNGFGYNTTDYSAGEGGLGVPWEYADMEFDLVDNTDGYSLTTGPRETKTRVMIQPAGQTPVGTTSLYLVEASALEFSNPQPENFYLGYTGDVPLPPEWMQIQGQTLINSGITNADGSVMGLALVSGTAGLPVDVTPTITQFYTNRDATFNDMKVYQLVSQCVATTPSDRSRTNLGVGEQVNLSFNPPLLTNYSIVTWSATAGSLLYTNGSSTLFTAPSNATNVTVTATIGNYPINLNYQVFAPTGYASAQIVSTNHFSVGEAAAEMHLNVIMGPTNVSFYQVQIEEVGENATNITGYFTNFPTASLFHGTADQFVSVNTNNTLPFGDECQLGPLPAPPPSWSAGGFTWPIPVNWKVGDNGATNSIAGWSQIFSMDNNATITIQKFGHSVTRTTNDIITIN